MEEINELFQNIGYELNEKQTPSSSSFVYEKQINDNYKYVIDVSYIDVFDGKLHITFYKIKEPIYHNVNDIIANLNSHDELAIAITLKELEAIYKLVHYVKEKLNEKGIEVE